MHHGTYLLFYIRMFHGFSLCMCLPVIVSGTICLSATVDAVT